MILTKQWVHEILETMPEIFSANEFIDKIIINYEIETAREEAKNGNFSSAEETEATIPKWLKDN